jgi:NTE family protein
MTSVTIWGLVLGGGGPVGVAWYAGLAEGLAKNGVSLSDADVIVGTSAGANAGAWLASGQPLDRFVDAVMRNATDNDGVNFADDVQLDLLVDIYAALGAAVAPLESDECLRVTALAKGRSGAGRQR